MVTASGELREGHGPRRGGRRLRRRSRSTRPSCSRAMRSLLRIKAYQATIEAQAADARRAESGCSRRVIRDQVEELERLGLLRRFLPPQLADAIVASGDDSVLEEPPGARSPCVYTGLRGFTRVSETAAPEEVIGRPARVPRGRRRAGPRATTRRSEFFSYDGLDGRSSTTRSPSTRPPGRRSCWRPRCASWSTA